MITRTKLQQFSSHKILGYLTKVSSVLADYGAYQTVSIKWFTFVAVHFYLYPLCQRCWLDISNWSVAYLSLSLSLGHEIDMRTVSDDSRNLNYLFRFPISCRHSVVVLPLSLSLSHSHSLFLTPANESNCFASLFHTFLMR